MEKEKMPVMQLLRVFEECFIGEPHGVGAFLSEDSPGLFTFLSALSAEEANRPSAGASIAVHARHIALCLDIFIKAVEESKDTNEMDWSEDWDETPVTDEVWLRLQAYLHEQIKRFKHTVGHKEELSPESYYAALGALAHTAFHLGAVHVKYEVLKGSLRNI